MKKLIAIAVTVVLVIAAFTMVGAVSAGPPVNPAVFEADIVAAPWGGDSLSEGKVEVKADGSAEVKIEDATAGVTYRVWLGQASWSPWTLGEWIELGTITIDSSGNGVLELPAGSISGQWTGPVLAISRGGTNHFISGFNLP